MGCLDFQMEIFAWEGHAPGNTPCIFWMLAGNTGTPPQHTSPCAAAPGNTEGKGMGTANDGCLQQGGTQRQEKTLGFNTCSNKQEAMYLMPRLIAINRLLSAAGHI